MSLVPPPTVILNQLGPAAAGLTWVRVGGGFSGAAVWRGDPPGGEPLAALKAWPPGFPATHLADIHRRMRQARLLFVPDVLATTDAGTVVEHAGRCWDLTRWMPGAADFHA